MNITSMQEKAALEFYKTKNWERAARVAGYKSTSAASELRCNRNVLERIKQLEQEDSLEEFATKAHCTDILIRAALGQVTEVKIGKERYEIRFGSKVRKQVVIDCDGNVRHTTVTFEYDPFKALELLMKLKGWLDSSEEERTSDQGASSERIMAAVRRIVERRAEKSP